MSATPGKLRVEPAEKGHYILWSEQGMAVAITSWNKPIDKANAERIARAWNALPLLEAILASRRCECDDCGAGFRCGDGILYDAKIDAARAALQAAQPKEGNNS